MFRSALDALDVLGRLKQRRISLHMIDFGSDVTGDAICKLVFTILSAVAEAERDRTRVQGVGGKAGRASISIGPTQGPAASVAPAEAGKSARLL